MNKLIISVILTLLKGYRYFISPFLQKNCRFYPSCSVYAIESFQKHGVTKGFYLATKRVLRCNPFTEGGYDPVP
jgi:putative membrane protein insertion efficiency factor